MFLYLQQLIKGNGRTPKIMISRYHALNHAKLNGNITTAEYLELLAIIISWFEEFGNTVKIDITINNNKITIKK